MLSPAPNMFGKQMTALILIVLTQLLTGWFKKKNFFFCLRDINRSQANHLTAFDPF